METIEERNARNKAYYDANKAKILAHKADNYDRINVTRRARTGAKTRQQYVADFMAARKPPLHYRNLRRVRDLVHNALIRTPNSRRFRKLLGCSSAQFRLHIESQLQPGWSWENYGTVWECDHIKPVASFDFTQEAQVLEAAHFSNIRPLTPDQNRMRALSGKSS